MRRSGPHNIDPAAGRCPGWTVFEIPSTLGVQGNAAARGSPERRGTLQVSLASIPSGVDTSETCVFASSQRHAKRSMVCWVGSAGANGMCGRQGARTNCRDAGGRLLRVAVPLPERVSESQPASVVPALRGHRHRVPGSDATLRPPAWMGGDHGSEQFLFGATE